MFFRCCTAALLVLATTLCGLRSEDGKDDREWQALFNGKDMTGCKRDKVIDDAVIDGPTGGSLDNNVLQPGPLLLQGDHGKVAYRNIEIRPCAEK